ncbi:hypothetical protein P7D22_10205 [Lichenihabitans sp. Uapishka_5]|uniref:hypothetical protein n=1 Tax=Lichenihabitans sp. Uapishka_5 TaxID=3037302 RepID=UPI0029E812F7|nr:hypothetical protein [Lichenihabitans sp. Uapishka_5]MDX7951539.1 hypothetical protein [Lichenihabitans sp. Uapishka_5]
MTKFITTLRVALSNRRAYHRALNEIAKIDARELNDMNVDRETLVGAAHRQVYGHAR